MTDESETGLPIEPVGWHWALRRDRIGERRRDEGAIAARWLARHLRRHRATLTRIPTVTLPQGCIDHWGFGVPCIAITARAIIGGQDHGLPERLLTDAGAVAIPKDPFSWESVAPRG